MKEHKASSRHIDLGICAVGAFAIAATPAAPEVVPLVAWR